VLIESAADGCCADGHVSGTNQEMPLQLLDAERDAPGTPASAASRPRRIRSLFAWAVRPWVRRRRVPREVLHFHDLKRRSDDDWRNVLADDPVQAARWIYAAATYGDTDAQLYWAQMLLSGRGTSRDSAAAFRWFEIAARSERADAVNMLGRCHERGWGTEVDFTKAAACYRSAAERSHDWAQFNLGCLLLKGNGIAHDPDRAFDWFMKAADQGHVKSIGMIGRSYENGWGCPPDKQRAIQWYRRAAEGEDFRAQYRYGQLLFEDGDWHEGIYWIQRAIQDAPDEFCRCVASDLLSQPDARLRSLGERAQARAVQASAARG